MKALLLVINPGHGNLATEWGGQDHLGPAYLGAALQAKGHEADIRTVQSSDWQWLLNLPLEDYGLIGLSVLYQQHLHQALDLARQLRRRAPKVHITIGGHPATMLAHTLLETNSTRWSGGKVRRPFVNWFERSRGIHLGEVYPAYRTVEMADQRALLRDP